jgi:hypothetical protein
VAALEGGDLWGPRPLALFFLGSYWYYRGDLSFRNGIQGEANSQLWVVSQKIGFSINI